NRRECRGLDHDFLRPSPSSGRRDVVRWYYCCASTASANRLAASAADRLVVLTNSVITSIAAPRYFCRMVMLWAKLRTNVPALIESFRSCCDFSWQGLKPLLKSTSSLAGMEPLAWLKIVWKSFDMMR